VKERKKCFLNKMYYTGNIFSCFPYRLESDAVKFSEMVALTEFLTNIASINAKEQEIPKLNNEVI